MNQAFHILKKDIRHLCWEIPLVPAFALVFALAEAKQWPPSERQFNIDPVLVSTIQTILLVTCFVLVCRVVLEEPLTGDTQFWITRPYAWKSLLLSKVLFILLFVSIPLAVGQCLILLAVGFNPISNATGLAWKQLSLGVAYLLPALTIAALTNNIARFAAFGAGMLAVVVVLFSSRTAIGVGWIYGIFSITLFSLSALIVVCRQYSRRRTTESIAILVGVFAILIACRLFLPWPRIVSAYDRLISSPGSLTLSFDPDPQLRSSGSTGGTTRPLDTVELRLPIKVDGLAEGFDVDTDWSSSWIEIFDSRGQQVGERLSLASGAAFSLSRRSRTSFVATISIDRAVFSHLNSEPATLKFSLDLTAFSDMRTTTIVDAARGSGARDIGFCVARGGLLHCISPVRGPSRIVARIEGADDCLNSIRSGSFRDQLYAATPGYWRSQLPISPSLSPLVIFSVELPNSAAVMKSCPRQDAPIVVAPQRIESHFHQEIEAANILLKDYAVQ